jgi:membrane protease YdiL (CAAX protease family)
MKAPTKVPKKAGKKGEKDIIQAKQARSKVPKKQGWGLLCKVLVLLIWVVVAVIAAQLIVGYLMLWILGRETFLQPVPTAIYSALSYILAFLWIVFATPMIISKLKKKENPIPKIIERNELGLRGMPTWTDIGLAPVGFIVATLLAAGLVAIFNIFPWFDAGQAQKVGFSTLLVGFDKIIAFLILVVVAPIAEELIFRGWLYGKLRAMLFEKMSDRVSMAISIFLVSLAFGIVHMQWNVGVNVFAMSVVLCSLREITGTIYAGILMHMIKNGVAFYLLYVLGIG